MSELVVVVGIAGFALCAYGATYRVARENAKSQCWLLAPTGARTFRNVRSLTRLNRLLSSAGMAICLAAVTLALLHPIGR